MNILIVEDDPMVRNINKGFVKKINSAFQVFEAGDIEKAKAVIGSVAIDLVLLDVYLGNDKGPDLLGWIRTNSLDIDVILITADNSAETVEKAFRLGSIDYLIKPFNFSRFDEAISKVITRRSKLSNKTGLNQEHIDSMIQNPAIKSQKPADKGINVMTYDLILKALRESTEPMTAQAIGKITELARVTVRRYLEYMVDEGVAEEMQHYGKVGRPQKTYVYKNRGINGHEN
ncbi:MAG: response regulator [Clostridia bacterium]|nr:response regulator [Clostridia bacterium]